MTNDFINLKALAGTFIDDAFPTFPAFADLNGAAAAKWLRDAGVPVLWHGDIGRNGIVVTAGCSPNIHGYTVSTNGYVAKATICADCGDPMPTPRLCPTCKGAR